MLIGMPDMREIPVNSALRRPIMLAQYVVVHRRAQKHLGDEQEHQPCNSHTVRETPWMESLKVIQHGLEPEPDT